MVLIMGWCSCICRTGFWSCVSGECPL